MSQNVQHFFCASSNFDQKLWLLWLFGHSLWKYHTILWTALESRSTWIWQSFSIRLSWYYWLIHLQYQSICVKVIANNLYCSNCNYCLRSALDIRQHLYIDLSVVEEGWRGLCWFLFVFPAVGSAGSLVSIPSAVSHPVLWISAEIHLHYLMQQGSMLSKVNASEFLRCSTLDYFVVSEPEHLNSCIATNSKHHRTL